MNQANQKAVVQEANMTLVSIRQAEISYFSSFFSNFGTQSAVLIGCTIVCISQLPTWDADIDMFWIGLALRGPEGSMIRAVEGMVVEQNQIIVAFVFAAIWFALEMIGLFWVMFSQACAIACSLCMLGALFIWYHFCLRIYNRFNWNKFYSSRWQEEDEAEEERRNFGDLDPNGTSDLKTIVPLKDPRTTRGGTKQEVGLELLPTDQSADITHSAYISIQIPESSQSRIFSSYSSSWKRCYLILRNGSMLYYYSSKQAFSTNPSRPMNLRPLDLSKFTLSTSSSNNSNNGNVHASMSFILSLIPTSHSTEEKTWHFRCDTATEFNEWVDIFSKSMSSE
eukprot:gene26924-35622_t